MDKYKIPNVKMFEFTKIIGVENIDFGKYIIIDDFVLIYAKNPINIGNYVHIASFTSISGGGEFVMGDFSAISSGCRIVTGTDDFKGYGFGNSTIANEFRNITTGKVSIGKFAIVGGNSVILPGVTIGEGTSVGAGSIVTKDLEPWGIYIGNKRIGWRNKKEVLKTYEKFKSLSECDQLGTLFNN
ncbi:acetyltransferase [Sulfurovum riftiae]|uniref:Chloramphenicol acetyltransferase n=2 Tax=Sulfurovum riftiae TaxID=1630136 RepID=A0A151CHI5_9BACT|nr:acetyltransferase [Sulfurovum riftiae]